MKHKLIKTENYLLVVSDEKPTTEREWVYDTVYGTEFKDVRKATTLDTTKIIAHLPLNGAPYLDGVDLLPDIDCNQLKLPVAFECEMESGMWGQGHFIEYPKTITNSEGRIELVGIYKF